MGEKMREKCLSAVEHEKTLIDNDIYECVVVIFE